MNRKYLVLYLIAGSLALLLIIYQTVVSYPEINISRTLLNAVMCIFFYYLAYKSYHEKKDDELM